MVEIVTGAGTGLERSSGWVLGSRGQLGDASFNRYGENVYVNAANGNLVINRTDEVLIGLGQDDVLERTYNSEGDASDDNADNWMFNAQRHLKTVSGTANTTGSTITLVDWDGSNITYTYNATSGVYTYQPPTGALDTLSFDGAHTWTLTNGSTLVKDVYDSSNSGRIVSSTDRDNNKLSYAYNASGQLSTVTTPDGESTTLTWSGNDITSIVTTVTGGTTLTRVYYGYDSYNRLSTVTTDLSPNDNSLGSDAVTTTYGYASGGSKLVTSISQTGGANLAISYDSSGRVSSLVQTMATGVTNTTGFDYSTAGQVSITNNAGQISVLHFDSSGDLTQMTLPPAQPGFTAQTTSFTYNSSGAALTATDGLGNVTDYTYDANGNLTRVQNQTTGETVDRTYGSHNELLTETTYAVAADIVHGTGPSQPSTTRYAYNANIDVSYIVSAMGEVTHYVYDTALHGEVTQAYVYRGATYSVSTLGVSTAIATSALDSWLATSVDLTQAQRTDTLYDARGVADRVTTYSATTSAGAGDTTQPWSRVSYTTDQAGNLLTRQTVGETNIETFVYDGLNRITSSIDINGATTSIAYSDGTNTSTITLANGLTEASVYNLAGQLVSYTKSSTIPATTSEQTKYSYDAMGNLIMVTDAVGNDTYFLYDTLGRKIARISADGELTEYVYDADNRVITTIQYATKVATSALLSGTTPLDPTLASIRPASLSTDLWSWNIYDATGNLLETVDPRGNATVYTYDAMNRLISSKSYYLRVATTVTNTWRTTPQTTVRSPTANALDDLTRYFYDADGRQVGVLDGDGYLTQTTYNEAGQKTATIAYATAAASSLRVSADMPTLLTSVGSVAADIHTQYFYDNRGFLVYTLDDNLRPTYYVYDQAGHVIQTIDYAGSITSASGYPYSYVQAQVAALSTTGARMDYSIYNSASGQLAYTIDAVGDVVGYGYDGMGNVDKITQYAALHAGLTSSPSYSSMGSWVTSHAGSSDRITRKVYDQYDRLAYTIDALGHITEDRYDADDRVVLTIRYPGSYTVSDTDNEATLYTMTGSGTIPSGAVTTGQSYDSDGRVSDSFDAMGVHTANTYDVFDRVTDRVMGTGTAAVKTHYTYDAAGRVLTQTLAYTATEAAVTTYTYDGMGRVLTVTDPAGHVTTYTYDQIGQKLTATVPIDGTHSAVTTDAYDGFGNVASVINAAGNTSTYTYDWMGNVLTATVPLDPTHYAVTTDAYDSFGDLVSSTDALGNATTYTYDALGRVLTQTAPLDSAHNAVTTDAYDAFGDLTAVTDARGDTTTYAYDLLGRVVTATVPLTATTNAVTTDVYNVFGDLIQKTDPAGHVTLYYYDALDRLILEVNGVGDVTGYTYAATGGIATVTQYATLVTGAVAGTLPAVTANAALDETTTFTRDKLDRVTSITDADGYVQSFTLDAMGNRLTATNNFTGAPATTTNTYDYAGHLLTETLPITARNAAGALVPVVNVYTYDVSGNLITKVEASGLVDTRTTSYTYDEANRLTGTSGDAVKVVGNNLVTPTGTTTPTTSIQYDANGNIIEQTDANGAHTFFYYDMDNRKIAEVAQNDVAGTQATLTNWVYDKNGNVTSMTVYGDFITPPASAGGAPPSPVSSTNARTTLYAYDYDNRLTTTTVSALRSGTLGATYATSIADVTTSTVYDKDGNVLQQVDGLGNTTWTYYDNAGHRIGQVDQDGYLTTWAVDAFGNVTTEKRYATAVSTPTSTTTLATIVGGAPSSATNDRVTTFVYDQMGRRKSETRTGVISYTLNSANAPVLGATSSTINYTYNGLGEVLTKEEATGDTTTYAYDLAGRETLVTGATITDYTGASVAGVVSQSYDGLNNLIQSAAGVAGSLTRVTTYTYGAGGRLATMSDATAIPFTRTYEYDANGNTVKVSYTRTESNGSTVTEADATQYDAQGRAILQSVATQTGSTWTLGDTSQVQYDAYGEVSARGVNGIWQEQLSYDAGGRLVRSTAGDGSVRLFAYDAAGHQTLEIDSSGGALPAGYSWSTLTLEQAITLLTTGGTVGTVAVAGMVVTMTAYDKRGQAVETRQPLRQLGGSGTSTIDTTKTYNAFGEVLTQTDARGSGYTTSFVYNTLGKIIEQIDPSVSYTSESGVVASAAPTTHNYYDISGRLIGVEDANGNTNTRSLLAGTGYDGQDVLVLQEFHADGGIFTNKYDAFDDLRQTVNEVGNTENYIYDGMDRLIEDDHQSRPAGSPGNPTTSAVQLIDYYAYDGLGQRIQHWNNQLGTSVKETTDYDAQGRVVSMVDLGGNATTYSYSWNGATATSGLGTFGAWTKTTVNDAGLTAIDTTDYFGREVAKTDFGGHVYAYTYDLAGRLLTTTSAGVDTVDTYYNTNQLASVTNGANVSTYQYDVAGNRTNETFANAAGTYENATTTWDALNRMVTYSDTGGTEGAPAAISWQYDLNGNIRRMTASAPSLDAYGAITPGGAYQDYWYKYDSMNRFVMTQAAFDPGTGTIYLTENGPSESFTYDAAGERVRMGYTTSHQIDDNDAHETETVVKETDEVYTYTADGYLAEVGTAIGAITDYYASDPLYMHLPAAPTGPGATSVVYTYDAMGRVTDYVENDASGVYAYERSATYDNKSEVTHDVVTSVRSDGTYVSTTSYDYGAAVTSGGVTTYTGAYQGGDVTHSHTTTMKGSSAQPTTDTVNTYVWWDSAQQAVTTFNPDTSHTTLNTSTYYYDSLGHISSVYIADGRPRTVTFVTDNDGEVLRRDEADSLSSGDPHEIHWYFNGVPVGDVTNNGASNVDYAVSISEHITAPGTGPFLNGSATSTSYADFDESYDPINGLDYDSTASSYTVNTGDTLESIAQQLWGDSSFWYMIADANGLSSDADLVSGMDLIIPNKIHNDAKSATTYAVYDPNEALGNDSPTAPKTPKHHAGCGVVGEIIIAVVAVVVTVVTAGAAVAALAPLEAGITSVAGGISAIAAGGTMLSAGTLVAIGAGSAALGSIVSQGVGLAIGAQSKFNWGDVAEAAIGGAVGAGLGPGGYAGDAGAFAEETAASPFLGAALRGITGSIVGQGIDVATGLQSKFDWAAVASAGVSAGVASQFQGTNFGANSAFMNKAIGGFIGGMAGDIAGAAVRTLSNGSDFGDNIISGLPDVASQAVGAGLEPGDVEPAPLANNNASPGTQTVNGVEVPANSGQVTVTGAPPSPLTAAIEVDDGTQGAGLTQADMEDLDIYGGNVGQPAQALSGGIVLLADNDPLSALGQIEEVDDVSDGDDVRVTQGRVPPGLQPNSKNPGFYSDPNTGIQYSFDASSGNLDPMVPQSNGLYLNQRTGAQFTLTQDGIFVEAIVVTSAKLVPINVIMHYYDTHHAFNGKDGFHGFLEIQSGSKHYYLSGGPTIGNGTNGNPSAYEALMALRYKLGLNLTGLDPQYGNLGAWASSDMSTMEYAGVGASGDPVPNTPVKLGTITNMSWGQAQQMLANDAIAVDNGNITYDAGSENSNSLAFSAAGQFGFTPVQQQNWGGHWFPGSQTVIFPKK